MVKSILVVVVWLALVITLIFALPPQWLRDAISRNWPVAEGTIEGGEVFVVGAQNKVWRAKLRYTYKVNDRLWGGTDTQDFNDNETASDYVESRNGVAAQVKYNPRRPQRSFLM